MIDPLHISTNMLRSVLKDGKACQTVHFGTFDTSSSITTTAAELNLVNEIFSKSSVDCKVEEGLDQAVHLNIMKRIKFKILNSI